MSNQTLVFNDVKVNKKDFYSTKKAISLNLVDINNIVSYRIKQNNDTYKYFIGYLHDDDVIRPLCIVLPQMSGYIYFENGGKNMSFKTENVHLKYSEIWNNIKSILNVKLHSQPIYDENYIKTKVKTFNSMINTLFSGDKIPKVKIHYICISAICIDIALKKDKKNYRQTFLEQCKYKIKKGELTNLTDDEVILSSDYESDFESDE